jgi:STAS-like domain of unknown function (DUF4325)
MRCRLVEQGSVFSTRARGVELLSGLEASYFGHPLDPIVLDFDGVKHVSFAFADEFVGRLVQRAHDNRLAVPQIVNVSPEIQSMVGLSLRSRELPDVISTTPSARPRSRGHTATVL